MCSNLLIKTVQPIIANQLRILIRLKFCPRMLYCYNPVGVMFQSMPIPPNRVFQPDFSSPPSYGCMSEDSHPVNANMMVDSDMWANIPNHVFLHNSLSSDTLLHLEIPDPLLLTFHSFLTCPTDTSKPAVSRLLEINEFFISRPCVCKIG